MGPRKGQILNSDRAHLDFRYARRQPDAMDASPASACPRFQSGQSTRRPAHAPADNATGEGVDPLDWLLPNIDPYCSRLPASKIESLMPRSFKPDVIG
jgi:hypothetical protein